MCEFYQRSSYFHGRIVTNTANLYVNALVASQLLIWKMVLADQLQIPVEALH